MKVTLIQSYLRVSTEAVQMSALFFILVVWAFVTAFGHLSWVVARAVLRFLTGHSDPVANLLDTSGHREADERTRPTGQQPQPTGESMTRLPDPADDIAAFERMMDALASTDKVSVETAKSLKVEARDFAGIAAATESGADRSAFAELDELTPFANEEPLAVKDVIAEKDAVAGSVVGSEVGKGAAADVAASDVATSESAASGQRVTLGETDGESIAPREASLAAKVEAAVPPAGPKRALSDVISSFLADHNIRWGELVAGLMIVICSIGLVVSLWSTLTSTHRVVPSIIFMSADAAIFAAGLYTMRRWKLEHTSRAILIIATLLVPLSVLAGMSAAGANVDTVSLASPMNLGVIALASVGVGWLLWQSSIALVGPSGATALTASVMAPSICLPLLPAVGRWLEGNAGGFLIVPALVSALSLLIPARRQFRSREIGKPVRVKGGVRFGENHWLRLGVAVAALASVIAYAAFLYRADGREAWIQIAIVIVPVWVAIAMLHAGFAGLLSGRTTFSGQATHATNRFLCVVFGVIALGCALLVLPASIERVSWVWAHAAAIAGAVSITGFVLHRRSRFAEASVPLGIAALLTAPVWISGASWSGVSIWHALIGGDQLIVAIGLMVVSGIVWAVQSWRAGDGFWLSKREGGQTSTVSWMMVGAIWATVVCVQSVVLSVAPLSWLGWVPVWVLAFVLLSMMLVAFRIAITYPRFGWSVAGAGVFFWTVCFGLVRWEAGRPFIAYESGGFALIGLAGSLLVLAIVGALIWQKEARQTVALLLDHSAGAACGIVAFLCVQYSVARWNEAVAFPTWGMAGWQAAVASGVIAGGVLVVPRRWYLQIAMLMSCVAVLGGVTHYGGVELWQRSDSSNSILLWNAAMVLIGTAFVWSVAREAVRWLPRRRHILLSDDREWSRIAMPDGWFVLLATVLLFVGVLWQYLDVLRAPLMHPDALVDFSEDTAKVAERWIRRGLLLIGLAGLVGANCVREPNRTWQIACQAIGVAIASFLAVVVSNEWFVSPSTRLISATSMASVGVLGFWLLSSRYQRRFKDTMQWNADVDQWSELTLGVLLLLASVVLVRADWWYPLMHRSQPVMLSTLAVAIWWVLASMGLLYRSGQSRVHRIDESRADSCYRSGSSRRSDDGVGWADPRRILSAMLLPAAVGLCVSVLFETPVVVWWQASVLGSLAWLGIVVFSRKGDSQARREQTIRTNDMDRGALFSWGWVTLVGLVSAGAVFVGVLNRSGWVAEWSLPIGAATSMLAVWVGSRKDSFLSPRWRGEGTFASRFGPFVLPMMSGHVAVVAIFMGWIDASSALLVVMLCGVVGCLASAILVWRQTSSLQTSSLQTSPLQTSPLQAWHVAVQAVAIFVLGLMGLEGDLSLSTSEEYGVLWLMLIALAISAVGLMRFVKSDSVQPMHPVTVLPYLLGWFVALGGAFVLLVHPQIWERDLVRVTTTVVWIGACVVLWRSDRLATEGFQQAFRADVGVSVFLMPLLVYSIILLDADVGRGAVTGVPLAASMGALQLVVAWVVACSCLLRPSVRYSRGASIWNVSVGLFALGAAVGAASLSRICELESGPHWVLLVFAPTFATTVLVWGLPSIERWRTKLEGVVAPDQVNGLVRADRFGTAAVQVIVGLFGVGSFVSAGLALAVQSREGTNWGIVCLFSLAMLVWALFMLAEQTRPSDSESANRRRKLSVLGGLWTLALMAVLGQPGGDCWLLTATMRLLIAFVLTTGVIALALPRLLAGPFFDRWKGAMRIGSLVSACASVGSLAAMLITEMAVRQTGVGIPDVATSLVVVVAITLGGLAVMFAVVVVVSGRASAQPGMLTLAATDDLGSGEGPGTRSHWLGLDDAMRRSLLYAAQVIAAVAWLHLYLCRNEIAFMGLREVWPYIVMGIAFVSVGVTQWAIRRGDNVVAGTMRKTAMFLPMIPIVGFWLSGSFATKWQSGVGGWSFGDGTVPYEVLLVIGAMYYGLMSVMWKQGLPRVATVVLANAALWVTLTQLPGWDFLAHPQAWLIPPAACVLAVAHWQRGSLDPALGAAIRYGATLTIYLSSTADMLLSEIGTSLWGPIVLVCLALLGMLAGVVLRVKPFLFLGAVFVFVGVTSMVWHAAQSIDAVWPWWVFGITTGMLLLTALAGIERHRERLQQLATELARWES
ncbi:hypothetical protein [Rhodopirellula sallentina]|uniref:Putative membrane protein n=1 Tax=Rhodopirellula sallentina SM41 TaxID=1263870 RepID=M5UFJ7_9BACT|nr:hypothetical protein [Rhodopirellula sallentina]EMI54763.1 putative membrane protein [Rhodopirellula sallentina SM41]